MPYVKDCLRFCQDDRPGLDPFLTALENELQILVASYKQPSDYPDTGRDQMQNCLGRRSKNTFKPDSFIDSRARRINEKGGPIGTLGNTM